MEWRGLALFSTGIAWISYGITVSTSPRYGTVRGITVLLDLMPIKAWGALWMVCGVLCLTFCLRPNGRDLLGFLGAVIPATLWAVAYALGGFTGTGYNVWASVAPWLAHTVLIMIIARVTRKETRKWALPTRG